MKKLFHFRTLYLVIWTIVALVLVMTMPSTESLVRDQGQIKLPQNEQSERAAAWLKESEETEADSYSLIAVFTNDQENNLTADDRSKIDGIMKELKADHASFGIEEMITPLDGEEAAKQLVSEDNTAILAQIRVSENDRTISEVKDQLQQKLNRKGIQVYLTGSELIMEDLTHSIEEGMKKTEAVAIVFIIVVLIAVFRSPIIPIFSLATVGFSYVISMGIINYLVEYLDFPYSSFSQVFLVVVLFGIGTDYNILLYTRYKEELSHGSDTIKAMKATFNSAGKTVLYSGIAVMVGFAVLLFADFQLYRASSGVAIGIAVLLAILFTLNPFFMALFGKNMFWPAKTLSSHGASKSWRFLSSKAYRFPMKALLLTGALSLPWILTYSTTLSYNDLANVSDEYGSKKGIQIIEDHFSAGFSAPTTVVLRSDQSFESTESLQAMDDLAGKIEAVDGVAKVYSATRPAGEKIEELYLKHQLNEATGTINQVQESLAIPQAGLDQAVGALEQIASYSSGYTKSKAEDPLYIPDEAFRGADLQQAMNMYLSNDRKTAELIIYLDHNPYTREAMETVKAIEKITQAEKNSGTLDGIDIAIGGKTSQNIDLENVSESDFARTAILMLVGIAIVLLFVTRSFWVTMFIIASLLISYYASLGVSEWLLSVADLGMSELNWTVPFFGFIMIVALGVDYSIFFMMRYREEGNRPNSIINASYHIGTVVMSAAVILAGTFAALIPSGILTLIEVAMVVIIGVMLLSVVLLPIFLPAMVSLQEKLSNWGKPAEEMVRPLKASRQA